MKWKFDTQQEAIDYQAKHPNQTFGYVPEYSGSERKWVFRFPIEARIEYQGYEIERMNINRALWGKEPISKKQDSRDPSISDTQT